MSTEDQTITITNAVNRITEKLSGVLLQEFLKLPAESQVNIVLIKSAQLLLANILCHVAITKEELEMISTDQAMQIKELTNHCAFTGFSDKFDLKKH